MITTTMNQKRGLTDSISYRTHRFSIIFSVMFVDAFQDSDTDIPIRYGFDSNICNLKGLQAKTKVQTDVLDELLYADDMDKNSRSEAKMQRSMDQVSKPCDN